MRKVFGRLNSCGSVQEVLNFPAIFHILYFGPRIEDYDYCRLLFFIIPRSALKERKELK